MLAVISCMAHSACNRNLPTAARTLAENVADIPRDSFAFPGDWVGEWAGMLQIDVPQGRKQRVPMELHIAPLDSAGAYTWVIVYGTDKDERSYTLLPKDPAKGLYEINENNGIVLNNYLIGNELLCRFSVMGNLLLSSYERPHEGIVFNIISGKSEPQAKTGGVGDVPVVDNYWLTVRQRALLEKK